MNAVWLMPEYVNSDWRVNGSPTAALTLFVLINDTVTAQMGAKDSSNNNLNKINYLGLFAATSGKSSRRETHRARWQERRAPHQRF